MAKISEEALAYSATALQSGDLQAALAVRNREYHQTDGSFDEPIVRTMEHILKSTPALLADCPRQVLEPLRIAAAMMELWGTNGIRAFVTIEGELDYRFGTDAIAHMLHSHGCFLRSLEDFRLVGISGVRLLGAHCSDDCEACQSADGSSFTIDTVPELPLVACTCKDRYGCRVIVIADDNST